LPNIVAVLLAAGFLSAVSATVGGEPVGPDAAAVRPAAPYLIDQDFDQWVWLPITFSMMEDGRRALKRGEEIGYDHRGPLYRAPPGFVGPAGRMVEGADAYQGRSTLLEAGKSTIEVGLHSPYAGLFAPGNTYVYEIALKGQGVFHFRAWIGGIDPATGNTRWLGFPDLIKIRVTGAWRVYAATFSVPRCDRPPFKAESRISAAIVVESCDKIYLDNFRISTVGQRTNP
jgi:hypothetical protein